MNHRWHKEVITPGTEMTLKNLRRRNVSAPFYLAGGTALALHLGHRRSVDLDLFTEHSFNEDQLIQDLQRMRGFSVIAKARETLHVHLKGTRVSFLRYAYPLLFPPQSFLGVSVADPRDIACMKLNAIAGRGSRRDFVDLYLASQQYGLATLMDLFKQKHAAAHYSFVHVLKSLTFFEDAEKEPMPDMLIDISWPQTTEFFQREALRLW